LFKKRIVHVTRPQPLLRFATRFLDKRFSITQRLRMYTIPILLLEEPSFADVTL
jgi:hypothetical protein